MFDRGRPLFASVLTMGRSRSAAERQADAEAQHAAENHQREEEMRVALATEHNRRRDQEREQQAARAAEVAIVEEQFMKETQGRSCPSCGSTHTSQHKYCGGCGRDLAADFIEGHKAVDVASG